MYAVVAGIFWRLLLAFVLFAATGWGGAALWYRGPQERTLRLPLCGAWAISGLGVAIVACLPLSRLAATLALACFALMLGALCLWWRSIRPAHDRDWATDVTRLLAAEIHGDRVRLDNVRNFEWRSREDFTPGWETREYDLSQLASADLIVSYWMGPAIAHTLVSFGFGDGRQLVFSVEVRRTRGQDFSVLGGFFKQSELLLVAADERDIVRTRSNVRGEDVYLYRVGLPPTEMRALFEAYIREAQALQCRPRFYNTLFSNCTTLVYDMVKRIVPGLPWDIRLLASGYLPNYIYELGALDTTRPFAELQRRGYINPRAIAADRDPGTSFSRAIRRGLPSPEGGFVTPEDGDER